MPTATLPSGTRGSCSRFPVDKVIPWKYARDTYTSKEALGYDPVSGYPAG